MKRNCKQCNKEFEIYSHILKRNRGKFCSRKCFVNYLKKDPIKRFHTKYKKCSNGCWEWQDKIQYHGYGEICINKKTVRAHRFSYELFKDKIPKNMCVCHTCDNRKCVNPDHLWIGTNNDNIQDCIRKGRNSKGEDRYNAKFTKKDVKEIRFLYKLKIFTQKELADIYGTTRNYINGIVLKRTWKHI